MADNSEHIASTRQFKAFVDSDETVAKGPSPQVRLIAGIVAAALVLGVAATVILLIV